MTIPTWTLFSLNIFNYLPYRRSLSMLSQSSALVEFVITTGSVVYCRNYHAIALFAKVTLTKETSEKHDKHEWLENLVCMYTPGSDGTIADFQRGGVRTIRSPQIWSPVSALNRKLHSVRMILTAVHHSWSNLDLNSFLPILRILISSNLVLVDEQ